MSKSGDQSSKTDLKQDSKSPKLTKVYARTSRGYRYKINQFVVSSEWFLK